MATKKSIGKSPATARSRRESLEARREHRQGRNVSTKNPVARAEEQSELQKGKRKTSLHPSAARREKKRRS
jgi:hypothetical protein